MPGLSQLKQFNSDVLSIGDEARLRAARGEQPVRVPIPRGVADVDDSEEFVLGIPDADDDDATRAGTAEQPLDEDFSDITGARTPAAAVEGAAAAPAAIDLSNVLNPVASGAGIDQADSIPDLSLFEEPVEEAPPEPEPEEPSIADLGLEALLKSTGFRETAETDAVEELADTIEPELVPEQEAGAPIDFPDAFSAPPAAAPDVFSFEDAAVVPDIPGDVREDTDAAPDEGGFDGADDFAFSGTAIDLTEGLPADVAERDEAPADTTARELEVAADSATDFDDVFPDFETAAPVFADDADGMPSPSAFNEEQLVDAETRAADAAVDAAV
ncbi:MAG: hypothetical protein IJ191_04305, partial [Treponema sp.]|nr:hypothetical protein [Treponema sp.]